MPKTQSDRILYDAHIHLSDPFYADDMPYILTTLKETRMRVCCVSTCVLDSEATLRLAQMSEAVLPFVGIHPESAGSNDIDAISEMVTKHRVSGIGEIGLDPTYDIDMKQQVRVFEAQLALAERHDLPVSVHSRKSLDDILEILKSYRCRVLLHWFAGGKSALRRTADMGLYVSYGPLSVYAADRRRIMSLTSPDRILVETDGPVPFSRCFDKLHAQPAFLPSVVFAAAHSLKCSYDDMLDMLYRNMRAYLGNR